VENPAGVRASLGRWGGDLDDYTVQTRPKIISQAILLIQISAEEIHDLELTPLFSFSLHCHKHKHEYFRQTYAS
jgi:hypothetical protein